MYEPFFIKKVAVLGAGVMGAQIAAHCINAGIETVLFDLPSEGQDSYALVKKSIKQLQKLKPAPLATSDTADLLRPCQYEKDLVELKSCDLVIEAIAERLDWKEALYARIAPHLGEHTVLASNTSGLSINALVEILPEKLHERFCGVHFFNPPRYMHLAELIPAKNTNPHLLDTLETWLTSDLGKGVVRAKDTPNFIANRIGVFSLLTTLYHAERLGLGFDVVDSLTGVPLGRPKSATFRTMDVVGLDTLAHVVDTMINSLENDPWHAFFKLPNWLIDLIKAGYLGQKTGQGIYRKKGRVIEVYDIKTKDYREACTEISPEVKRALKHQDKYEMFKALKALNHPEAELITACFSDLFHYSAFHLESIAENVQDVDAALKWGFGWQNGPFELWQAFGVDTVLHWLTERMADNLTMTSAHLPGWVNQQGFLFYKDNKAFAPKDKCYQLRSNLAVYEKQTCMRRIKGIVFENEGVTLSELPDDILLLSFKTKSNTIGRSVLEGLNTAIDYAEKHVKGIVIYQHNPTNFSSGANLLELHELVSSNQMHAVSQMVQDFQTVLMRLKYSAIPVVAALRGRALGGGCELLMQSDAVVAAFESYVGLVEVGVGLIPAGGGSKELALRASKAAGNRDIMTHLKPLFEQVAMASVSVSATDSQLKHYLQAGDAWVMHQDEVLFAAIAKLKCMRALNYKPPMPSHFRVAGREGVAALKALLVNYEAGGFISAHDMLIASKLAQVMCGGEVDAGSMVDEAWILRLEHEAFMALIKTKETQARIQHLLETGKPLRN